MSKLKSDYLIPAIRRHDERVIFINPDHILRISQTDDQLGTWIVQGGEDCGCVVRESIEKFLKRFDEAQTNRFRARNDHTQ